LRESELEPQLLVLEITETTMLQNTQKTVRTLTEMKTLGIRFAVDDFGTGFSSLSYLQQFPVDILKIDKFFIDRITNDVESSAVARAIITIGDSLHLKTIAEGVETVEQLDELRKLGCLYGQGYHFAKPLSKKMMGSYLRKHLNAVGSNTIGGLLRKRIENRPGYSV
jgi:EAL domain-containing protein (putative c-di-GMP-specific phosphodiesterase class I)